jgi:acyl-coenzyme A thioesterase 13
MQNLIGKRSSEVSPSPFGAWLDFTMVAAEKGKLTCILETRKEFCNPGGIVHGGLIAGFIDEIVGMTTVTLGKPSFSVALNLNIDFLSPGILGETLTAHTEVIRDGKNITHVECKVYGPSGKLMAKACSNMMLTGIQSKA